MKSILFYDSGLEWGGGTNSLRLLCQHLDRNKYFKQVAFVRDYMDGEGRPVSEAFRQLDIPFHGLPNHGGRVGFKLCREGVRLVTPGLPKMRRWLLAKASNRYQTIPRARALADLARSQRVNLLYGNNQPSSNVELLLASEMSGIPAILHVRKTTSLTLTEVEMTNRLARRLICVSGSVAEHYQNQGIDTRLLKVIPNGIDVNLPQAPSPLCKAGLVAPGELLIGTASSLIPLKTVEDLIHAHSRLDNHSHPVHLLIMGDGPERKRLEALAEKLGQGARVHFSGFLSDAALVMPELDIFVLPSSQEGMPRTILEAMRASRPVIAADVSGSRDLVVPGETGMLYPHGDRQALAACLETLLSSPDNRQRLGEQGRQVLVRRYGLASHVSQVAAVIEEVLAMPGGTPCLTS